MPKTFKIVSTIAGLIRYQSQDDVRLPALSASLSFIQAGEESPPKASFTQSIKQLNSGQLRPDPALAFIQRYYSEEQANMLQIMPFLGRRATALFTTATKLSTNTLYDTKKENSKTLNSPCCHSLPNKRPPAIDSKHHDHTDKKPQQSSASGMSLPRQRRTASVLQQQSRQRQTGP